MNLAESAGANGENLPAKAISSGGPLDPFAFGGNDSRRARGDRRYRSNDYPMCLPVYLHEFCDWYIEMSKLALYGADATVERRASRQLLRELFGDSY